MSDASLESDGELAQWSPPPAVRAQLRQLPSSNCRAASSSSSSSAAAAAAESQQLQEGKSDGVIPKDLSNEVNVGVWNS